MGLWAEGLWAEGLWASGLWAEDGGSDTTPDAFAFTDQTGVSLGDLITSNEVVIAGINAAATVTITNGEYSIDGGAWASGAGSITLGQGVRVRHTSSAAYNTAVNTVLTIGGVSDTFTSTTQGAPAEVSSGAGRKRDARRRGILSWLTGRG